MHVGWSTGEETLGGAEAESQVGLSESQVGLGQAGSASQVGLGRGSEKADGSEQKKRGADGGGGGDDGGGVRDRGPKRQKTQAKQTDQEADGAEEESVERGAKTDRAQPDAEPPPPHHHHDDDDDRHPHHHHDDDDDRHHHHHHRHQAEASSSSSTAAAAAEKPTPTSPSASRPSTSSSTAIRHQDDEHLQRSPEAQEEAQPTPTTQPPGLDWFLVRTPLVSYAKSGTDYGKCSTDPGISRGQVPFWTGEGGEGGRAKARKELDSAFEAVSYTHLTLPTICSV
eukprot:368285-Rhodomonas_salina.3